MADLSVATANRKALADIKRRYDMCEITRFEAKQLAQPILDRINERTTEIAAQHGKKSYPRLDFINAMRNSY